MEAVNQCAACRDCQIILNCVVNMIILLLQNEPASPRIDTIAYRAACDQTLKSQWERGDQEVSQTRYCNVFGSRYCENITTNGSCLLLWSGWIVQGVFGGFWCLKIVLYVASRRNSVALLAPVFCSEKKKTLSCKWFLKGKVYFWKLHFWKS